MNPDTGETNDTVVSDNKDTDKVFATVAAAISSFFAKYPTAFVYANYFYSPTFSYRPSSLNATTALPFIKSSS